MTTKLQTAAQAVIDQWDSTDGEKLSISHAHLSQLRKALAEEIVPPPATRDCPHAMPHRYCDGCKVSPCPIGLGTPE